MDVMLQKHRAKHVVDTPDGLPELCADISREVIRSQPDDIYCFIADYLNTLLLTRENAKVAIKIVQSVTLKSEHIVEILVSTGLKLQEIAAVAPRLQKAFKVYLDAVDDQKKECGCDVDNDEVDDKNEINICKILRATGATYPDAYRAAIRIQALFRGHQERMSLAENRGEVQWQRAAANTVAILRKSGVTRAEATLAAITIQAAYRGYYTRRNLNLQRGRKDGKEAKEIVDMCAWFRMLFEESGITPQRANRAAIVIQVAYRRYRKRKSEQEWSVASSIQLSTPRSMRKGGSGSEVHTARSLRSVKSEVQLKSHSEIVDTESKSRSKIVTIGSQSEIIDIDTKSQSKIVDVETKSQLKVEDAKSESESKVENLESESESKVEDEHKDDVKTPDEGGETVEEPVKTEEVEIKQELPDEAEEVEKVEQAADGAEDQVVGEHGVEEDKEAAE